MEDPVAFDIWALVSEESKVVARELLHRRQPGMSRLVLLQSVVALPKTGRFVLFDKELGWSAAQELRDELETLSTDVRVYQTGYSPSEPPSRYCDVHRLHYGGVMGCHVCQRFFIP